MNTSTHPNPFRASAVAGPAALSLAVLLALSPTASRKAQAQFSIYPQRVELYRDNPTKTLVLTNQASAPATFRVQYIPLRMGPDGRYRMNRDPKRYRADDFLSVYPREVKLAADATETIRVFLRNVPLPRNRELRWHLLIQKQPERAGVVIDSLAGHQDANVLALHMPQVLGQAVPVFARGQKHYRVRTSIDRIAIDYTSPRPVLTFQLRRQGDYASVTGNFVISKLTAAGRVVVGRLNRVAIFPEITARPVRIRLSSGDVKPGEDRLHIRFSSRGGKGRRLLAEARYETR